MDLLVHIGTVSKARHGPSLHGVHLLPLLGPTETLVRNWQIRRGPPFDQETKCLQGKVSGPIVDLATMRCTA
jgi:hypothetical protein